MSAIKIDRRGVPVSARNGRLYNTGVQITNSSSSGGGGAPGTLVLASELLYYDGTKYTPYSAKKASDPGYPYMYTHISGAIPRPSRTSKLLLDAAVYATSLGIGAGTGTYQNYASIVSTLFELYNLRDSYSNTYQMYYDSAADEYLLICYGVKTSTDKRSNAIKIGDYSGANGRTDEHIIIDPRNRRFTINQQKIKLSQGTANKWLALNADKEIEYKDNPLAAKFIEVVVPGLQTLSDGANSPTITSFATNLKVKVFSGTLLNEVFFEIQIPENYANGTDIIPVVAWMPMTSPATSEAVFWWIDYEWVNKSGTFTGTSTRVVYGFNTLTTGFAHLKTEFGAITGTGKTKGSILSCRLFRDPTYLTDTYTDGAGLLSVGFKLQVDSLGS